ncbi:MAG: hypothetical protein HC802_14620 [Caldilineaceae bacterium]|nr:hypothetical protein [Caldilineaceae bacterium]
MPRTLRLADGNYMRGPDVHHLIRQLYTMKCIEVVGFSNVGKSALLRLIGQEDVWTQELGEAGQEFLPVYVDCNRMLGLSAQGFYELVLRCLQESSGALSDLPALVDAYEALVAPASDFQVPLSFNRGLNAALATTSKQIILLFDEFDEPFTQIDPRVFLNLRALRDRHSSQLAYLTASGRTLNTLRSEGHCAEFCELFNAATWHLAPLTAPMSTGWCVVT